MAPPIQKPYCFIHKQYTNERPEPRGLPPSGRNNSPSGQMPKENESLVPKEAYKAAVDAFHSIYFEEADVLGGITDAATIIHRYAVAYKNGEYEK